MDGTFDVLGEDHLEVKRICDDLESAPDAAHAQEADLTRKLGLVERLIIVESKHEAIEEQLFWPFVRERVPDGDVLADQAVAQESSAKYMLDALRTKKPKTRDFEPLIARFIVEGRAHIAFEEERVWPVVRNIMTEHLDAELGKALRQAKQAAPTRPHPGTPPKPAVLKTLGKLAAVMDRLRDAVTNRGRRP